jgi:transcriptional regulator of nitric oxide reductase
VPPASLRSAVGLVALFALTLGAPPVAAQTPVAFETTFRAVFPSADRFGPREGQPPAYAAYRGDELAGYVFFSKDVGSPAGYAGRPLNIAVGLTRAGTIAGAELIEHSEPILMIGVPEAALARFVRQYAGLDIRANVRLRALAGDRDQGVDAISGATVSSLALNDAIVTSARAVARTRGILAEATGSALDLDSFESERWPDLIAAGSITRRTVTVGEAARELRALGAESPVPGSAAPDTALVTLYAALATPAQIGQNLLGAEYRRLTAEAAPGTSLIFIAADGLYSFKGRAWLRTGHFDRIQLAQGATTISFTREQHHRLDRLAAAESPELREMAVFVVPPETGFDPSHPWRLDLTVMGQRPDGSVASVVFSLPYVLPDRHKLRAAASVPTDPPLWQQIWEARWARIAILALALLTLASILIFQDAIAQRLHVWRAIRLAAAGFTLAWLGWYTAAQLSVVNVLTFANALLTKFEWEFFLLDPLIFILWSFVAVALLFWGRGVFCGWLCPFGALQELLNRLARRFGVRQVAVPFGLHERLWPIKYVAFLALFAVSLGAIAAAIRGAEIEPFKTAINLGFRREWYFVGYALALLAAGLFIERFFCRYLCPLGAALAIPARLRLFEWLKRHWQCGRECHICAVQCPVQAIHPDGRINPNECIYCLRCQTLYYDDTTCPALIARRRRREERAALRRRPTPPETT